MAWNGADLVSDFSSELGDTSSAFQTKVLRWINEGIRDISTSFNWPFLREKGKAILASGQDTHTIVLSEPTAPTLAALAGGSLALVPYQVLITYYESESQVESKAGTASSAITPAGGNLSITVSAIPVSASTLVTARRVYLSKNGGAYYLYSTIANNTATTTTITTDTTDTTEPPDQHAIGRIDGDFFISGDRVIQGYTIQRLRFETNGATSSGTPNYWAPFNQEQILVYPTPTSNTTVEFYYFKIPARVFNLSTSQPQMPAWLYDDLYNYVMWRGYAYRDRDGKESKQINYKNGLRETISRKGGAVKRYGRVRSITGDSDGYAI